MLFAMLYKPPSLASAPPFAFKACPGRLRGRPADVIASGKINSSLGFHIHVTGVPRLTGNAIPLSLCSPWPFALPGRSIEQIFEYTYTPLETAGKPDDYAYRITTAEHRHNVAAPSRTLEATRVVRTTEYKICSAVTSWLPRREPEYDLTEARLHGESVPFFRQVEVLRGFAPQTRTRGSWPPLPKLRLFSLMGYQSLSLLQWRYVDQLVLSGVKTTFGFKGLEGLLKVFVDSADGHVINIAESQLRV
ncbi:hypothetical protein E4U45_001414 [Claviceps purpurea]|nr:hypothetical protein E4U45_001414 [Claviceps purpurea]